MGWKIRTVWFAALLCTGPAAAQSSVTLYGRLNLDLEVVRGNGDTTTRVSSNSSRIGFRGSESLGSGLEAFFQLESSINADAGGGTLAGRDSFLGVRGGWGGLRFGNMKTPYDQVNGVFGNNPTFNSSILDTESLYGNGSTLATGGWAYRAPNSIRYDLPGIWMKGVLGGFQVSLGENSDDAVTYSFGGTWAPGPWQFGAVYQYNSESRGTGLDDWAYSLAIAYDFGAIRIAGVWEQMKYDTPTGTLKRDFAGISGTFDIGPGQLYAWFGWADDGSGSAANGQRVGGLARGPDTGAQHYEISYSYPLSRRTTTYVGYVKVDNDDNASYNFATNPLSNLSPGGKPEGFIAGIVHNF